MDRVKFLTDVITSANALYRKGGNSGLTDTEYDRLWYELQSLDPTNPLLHESGVIPETRKVTLPIPMASLEKVYCNDAKGDQLTPWLQQPGTKICSIKYDGAAVLLVYKNGLFTQAMTKGRDGIGQDITEHIKYMGGMPIHISIQYSNIMYIKAESVMKKSVFNAKYAAEYKNPRNL